MNDGFLTVAHAPFDSGHTSKALEHGIMGEMYEIDEMYPVFLKVADFQREEVLTSVLIGHYRAKKNMRNYTRQ